MHARLLSRPLRWLAAGALLALTPGPSLAFPAPTTPTFALACGGSGIAAGKFSFPLGVATDPLGNVYVSDRSNNRSRSSTTWGTSSPPGQPRNR
jgi:hypothetical protein